MSLMRLANKKWLQIFVGGLVLFIATEQALKYTSNPNYFPTVVLLGALLIPVTFVAYIYEHIHAREVPTPCLLICFLGGGTVGLLAAGMLEYGSLFSLGLPSLFLVGLIEEVAKLTLPMVQFIRGKYRSEADGLLFGVAAGMGFAALETMGYGMVSIIQSQGSVGALQEILIIRGFLSPAGHGAWTGLVCAVIWRERSKNRIFSLPLFITFSMAVFLHTFWNILNSPIVTNQLVLLAGDAFVVITSLVLLIRKIREATQQPPPEVSEDGVLIEGN